MTFQLFPLKMYGSNGARDGLN